MPTLPDLETIWLRMLQYAEECKAQGRPIYTLQRGVKNYITDVRPRSIGRRSDEGRSEHQQSRLTKKQAEQY